MAAGVSEIGSGELDGPPPGRSRQPGAGRRKAEDTQPGLRQALKELLEAATRGDPVAEVTWCSLSLRDLERQMGRLGFRCGKDALARMLGEDGYSLQGMARVLEGRQHPDRDDQFRRINAVIAEFTAAGDPASAWTGRRRSSWARITGRAGHGGPGDPVRVRDHDFPDAELGKITPYGVYDIAANTGFVSVGTSRDTAAFAVNALRLWWARRAVPATPARGGCWSSATPAAPTAAGPALERPARRPGGGDRAWRSRCATSRPARASGTRSSTGCSATSPAPGGPGR